MNKETYYVGDEVFEKTKEEIRLINRKRLEKELLSSRYLEDNSFHLSYVYLFNILADPGYFPDKTSDLLTNEYNFGSNYLIPDDQKKQFIKWINYGRLSVMLDNTDYNPTDDQLVMSKKVRSTFTYLKYDEKPQVYSPSNLYELNTMV